MVCPRPNICDAPRTWTTVTPNLCCDETEPRSIHAPDNMNINISMWNHTTSQKNIYMFCNIIKHSSMLKRTKVKIGSRTRSQEEDQGWVIQGLPGHCRKFRAKQRSNKWGTKNVFIHIVTRVHAQSLSHEQLCNSMDCRLPDSSAHGTPQARILEWVVIPFSRGSQTRVSYIFLHWQADSLPPHLLESPMYSLSRYSTGTLIKTLGFQWWTIKVQKSLVSLSLQFRD